MKKKRRFTKEGIIEGFKIREDKDYSELWIINGQLFRIDREGNVIPVRYKG